MKILILLLISIVVSVFLASNISGLVIQSVSNFPDKIAPGEDAVINMIVKNDAEADITDFSASLDLTDVPLAPYETGSEYSTDEIIEGKIKDIEFKIIALNDAKPGIYKIPVLISYTQDEEIKTKKSLISISIVSEPIIEVTIEDSLLLKGKENKLSVKIINKGLADAKFLEIEMQKSSVYYSLLSQEKVYIGDIDSNDFQTTEFQIFFKQNTPNKVNIPLTVKYKDFSNKEYNIDTNLELRVYSTQDAISMGLIKQNNTLGLVIFIVIVLIVIIIIYRIIRRRKRKTNEWYSRTETS